MSRSANLLVYYGHHKCGTRWVLAVLREACRELALRVDEVHNERIVAGDLDGFVRRGRLDVLAYTNADFAAARRLPPHRGFHVIRDPRDVVVSAYFSHRNSHPVKDDWPELAALREELRSLDPEEGLLRQIEHSADELRCFAEWPYDQPHVLEVRMEDLTLRPYEGFLAIFRFLGLLDEEPFRARARLRHVAATVARATGFGAGAIGLPRLPAERLLGIVWENDFTRKSGGRAPGEEDPRSHYRKGIAGDWKNHFGPRHVAAFKARYNDLLLRLGYEDDPDWGAEVSSGAPSAASSRSA